MCEKHISKGFKLKKKKHFSASKGGSFKTSPLSQFHDKAAILLQKKSATLKQLYTLRAGLGLH